MTDLRVYLFQTQNAELIKEYRHASSARRSTIRRTLIVRKERFFKGINPKPDSYPNLVTRILKQATEKAND